VPLDQPLKTSEKVEKKPEIKLWQGTTPWAGASWFSLFTKSYMDPYLDIQSSEERFNLKLEHMGVVDFENSAASQVPLMQETYAYYRAKYPTSGYNILRAFVYTQRWPLAF
jgi:hypothetical protein